MSDEKFTARALHIQRQINSPGFDWIRELLRLVARDIEDGALTCDDPSMELRALHHAQAARLIVQKFENALELASSETEGDSE